MTDLFGADLPVEGEGEGGQFAWRDGPLLRALRAGHWVVLDEVNVQEYLAKFHYNYEQHFDFVMKKGIIFKSIHVAFS